MLSRLNYIFATERDRFEIAIASLSDALSVDVIWLREHTRLTVMAKRWLDSRKTSDLLLTDSSLKIALTWLSNRPKSVPEINDLLSEFLDASRQESTDSSNFAHAKLRALTSLVEPILKEKVEKLSQEAKMHDEHWAKAKIRISSSDADEIRDKVKGIQIFFAEGGNWHPEPAVYIKNAGAHGDYAEIYQFPCCEGYAVLKDKGEPLQFRTDGCRKR